MSQFAGSSSSVPYWSPSSQRTTGGDSSEKFTFGVSDERSLSNKINAGLAPSAVEFVPQQQRLARDAAEFVPRSFSSFDGLRGKSEGSLTSMNGLNSSAASWVPSSQKEDYGVASDGVTPKDQPEEVMVEVNYNGSTFFVPSSAAYAYGASQEAGAEAFGAKPAQPDLGPDWGLSTVEAPSKRTLQTIGLPEPIRTHFQSLDAETKRSLLPDDDRHNEVPGRYHSILPLDLPGVPRGAGGSFGYPSALFKVVDRTDSQVYALRRIDNVRTCQPTVLKNAMTRWLDIRHPSIVSLYSISQERGGALFFAHAYHPMAVTLKQRFLDAGSAPPSEPMLWRILTQLMAGLRLVHSRGLAVRHISPTHIILTSGTVCRFNNVSVTDVLEFESRKPMTELQFDDIVKLGYVILSLAARVQVNQKTADMAAKHLHQTHSPELHRVVTAMISGKLNLTQISAMMLDKLQDELDSALASADALHSHLRSEYESGRLLRLMMKLGFVNERPEFALAPEWSETGDRYVLKLFRDYLFHQTMEDGAPVMDAGHVISCLNKLDAGDNQKILLCSRDSKDILVVSFADIRRCLEDAFTDLNALSDTAISRIQGQQQQQQQQLQQAMSTMSSLPDDLNAPAPPGLNVAAVAPPGLGGVGAGALAAGANQGALGGAAASRSSKLSGSVKPFNPGAPGALVHPSALSTTAAAFTPNSLSSVATNEYSYGAPGAVDTPVGADRYGFGAGTPAAATTPTVSGYSKASGVSSSGVPYGSGSGSMLSSNVYSSGRAASAPLYSGQQSASSPFAGQHPPLGSSPRETSLGVATASAAGTFPRTSPNYPSEAGLSYSHSFNHPGANASGLSAVGGASGGLGLGTPPTRTGSGLLGSGLGPAGGGLGGAGAGALGAGVESLARSPHSQHLHGLPHHSMTTSLPTSLPRSLSTPMYLSQQQGQQGGAGQLAGQGQGASQAQAALYSQHSQQQLGSQASQLYKSGYFESR